MADLVTRELLLWFKFCGRDWFATMFPITGLTVGLIARGHASIADWSMVVLHNVFFLYVNTLANQINGVDEDRINKPDRPIPSGLVSLQAANQRWWIVLAIYVAESWFLFGSFGLGIATVWISLCTVYDRFLHQHWFNKSIVFLIIGVHCMLLPPLQGLHVLQGTAANPWQLDSPAVRWCLYVSMGSSIGGLVQDLRDVSGDRFKKRETLPLVMGEHAARRFHSMSFIGLIPFTHFVLHFSGCCDWSQLGETLQHALLFGELMVATVCAVLAFRVTHLTKPDQDHWTYQTFCLCWFGGVLFISGFVLKGQNPEQ